MGYQNFFATKLAADVGTSDVVMTLETVPTTTSGRLVLEARNPTQREIIKYTGVAGSTITGVTRGQGGTSAKTHVKNALVEMNATSEDLQDLYDAFASFSASNNDWRSLAVSPSSVTALGNRSYTVVVPGDLTGITSVGQKLKLPRTVTAPTGSITLNGTTQYANDTSVSGMTFTDDFTVSAWVKLSSYPSNRAPIVQRTDGSSANGWVLDINSSGAVRILGYNGGIANVSYANTYQSVPLNKWVHISALLDMSAFTAASATAETAKSWIMIDGVEVPAVATRAGTNPTTLVQAGDLQIGKDYSTNYFTGQIAQVAIYSTRVLQATIRASMNQTLTGSETSLVSAYKLDQASGLNDLSANANNLTAQGSPSYSTTQTPFTNPVTGTSVTAGTTNYGIIMSQSFSTNTTYTVQVPEGETLPISGGIGTLQYSSARAPYAFPSQKSKWEIKSVYIAVCPVSGGAANGTWYNPSTQLVIPLGEWDVAYTATPYVANGINNPSVWTALSTTNNGVTDPELRGYVVFSSTANHSDVSAMHMEKSLVTTVMTTYYLNLMTDQNGLPNLQANVANSAITIKATNAYI